MISYFSTDWKLGMCPTLHAWHFPESIVKHAEQHIMTDVTYADSNMYNKEPMSHSQIACSEEFEFDCVRLASCVLNLRFSSTLGIILAISCQTFCTYCSNDETRIEHAGCWSRQDDVSTDLACLMGILHENSMDDTIWFWLEHSRFES